MTMVTASREDSSAGANHAVINIAPATKLSGGTAGCGVAEAWTGAAMPLLRACKEDPQSLCDVVAACAKAAAPTAGEQAAAKFVDAAMQAMALRR